MGTTGRCSNRGVLSVQLVVVALLAFACSRAPAGIEQDRYSVDGMSASASDTMVTPEEPESEAPEIDEKTGEPVARDVVPGPPLYSPPTHTAPSNWHVLDTNVGPKTGPGAIHRAATQWHNSSTNWWFWVPGPPPVWRGSYAGSTPAPEPEVGTPPPGTDAGGGTTTS